MIFNNEIVVIIKQLKYLYVISITLFLNSCNNPDKLFELKNNTGIQFSNKLLPTPTLNILNYLYYYNGAGVSAADFNNDGLPDLYFTANQTADKLYLNLGGIKFLDITEQSGIDNAGNWTTGSTTVDINNDGLLDIYICKIGNYNGITGQNLLYVNQGLNKNGIPTFKEEASAYGLDIKSFSTQAVFFDYDQDSDLDMFLLNHSVHPNKNYGDGNRRTEIDSLSGDKLFENVNGIFIDVSKFSGIFQGKIGYGLGVSVSDINNDGYADIYVGNDFFENDYLYINQKDKTFKEVISNDKTKLGHTSHFSMGNSISDINNNGKMDIISLDMLPEDLITYKTSGLEYPYQTYEYYLKKGYAPQYMQNTMHLNIGNGSFSEISYLSGIAATEWSWSPLVADYDNDGYKDIYITNGILGATNDMDFINFISNETIQKQLGMNMSQKELALAREIPQKKVHNYIFKNNGDNTFKNVTQKWSSNGSSYSNGGVYVDLDNDGDLDLVINNINETPFILENTSEINKDNNFIKIKFKGSKHNLFGIGVKVKAYVNNNIITEENYTTKGYLSSVEPKIHMGLGAVKRIDSLHIIWPNGSFQTLKQVVVNQEIEVSNDDASNNYFTFFANKTRGLLKNTAPLLNFKHKDRISLEFNRDPLIPYASTNYGPHISVADINNDQLDDVFICGGKSQSSKLFIQNLKGEFIIEQELAFNEDAINEDTYSVFFNANNDDFIDLLVVSGGNEFRKGKPLQPRLYINRNGKFIKDIFQFKDIEVNASRVKAIDIDNDGDLDISITSNLVPWKFGISPKQYIFENDGLGNFMDVTEVFSSEFQNIGNVQDIVWIDINNDNLKDAIVTGYWMPITIFINDGEKLILQKDNNLKNSNGWWNTINVADFDKDGDLDIVAGNWGLNTRLKASRENPLTLYSNDFDDNGTVDPVITYFYQNQETPFVSKDELVKQLPFLNKKYLSYNDFAHAKFNELLPKDKINSADKKKVFELASCYFENIGNNKYKKHQLPLMAQISSVNDIAIEDFNNDGYLDMLLVGNNYEISTQLGRLDASHGVILLNNKEGFFEVHKNQNFDISGPARHIQKVRVNQEINYIVSINNNSPVFLIEDQVNKNE